MILDKLSKRGERALNGLYRAFNETANEDLAMLFVNSITIQNKEKNKTTPSSKFLYSLLRMR